MQPLNMLADWLIGRVRAVVGVDLAVLSVLVLSEKAARMNITPPV